MGKSVKYSAEVRERAVRMLKEHEHEYPSRWAAIESIAGKIGCMERPAILSEFIDDVAAMIATFGSGDDAIADILTDAVAPTGHLPFDLPADLASVETQAEDAPHDFARTLFPAGFGLHFFRPSAPPGSTH